MNTPASSLSALTALAVAIVLLAPGPGNRLLFLAGARRGFWPALPLVGVQWLASCLAIGTWCTALGLAASALPWLPAVARIVAAAYVLWFAVTLWSKAPTAASGGAGALFTAALVDPAALFCAAVVFPPLGAVAAEVLGMYLLFTLLVLPLAAFRVAMGAMAARRQIATGRPSSLQRLAAGAVAMLAGARRMSATFGGARWLRGRRQA